MDDTMMMTTERAVRVRGAGYTLAATGGRLLAGTLMVALRTAALAAYTLLAMGAVFVVPLLCAFAFGSFAVAVLFGFVLQMPFPQKWEVLGFSVLIMFAYFAYVALMMLMLRLACGPRR